MNKLAAGLTAVFGLAAVGILHAGITLIDTEASRTRFHALYANFPEEYKREIERGTEGGAYVKGTSWGFFEDGISYEFINQSGQTCAYESSSRHFLGFTFSPKATKTCGP